MSDELSTAAIRLGLDPMRARRLADAYEAIPDSTECGGTLSGGFISEDHRLVRDTTTFRLAGR